MAQINSVIYINARVCLCVYPTSFPQYMTTNKVQICTFRNASDKT